MSKMKSKLGMIGLLASMGLMGTERPNYMYMIPETDEDKKQRLIAAEIERNKLNGLTEFYYALGSLWALNQKSADRKARKRNWI